MKGLMKEKKMDKKYSIEEVFSLIGEENLLCDYCTKGSKKKESIIVDGYQVYTKSLRYMTFYQKGVVCPCCGRKGSYFKLEGTNGNPNRRHFNLYCEDGTLMTKDHIIPKSLGGLDTVANLQPMCKECNAKKGNGEEKQYSLFSINPDGNVKKYTTLSNAVLSFISNKKRKKPEQFVAEVIEKSNMLQDAIKNNTVYRGRKWYIKES